MNLRLNLAGKVMKKDRPNVQNQELVIRVVVKNVLPGVLFAMQRGRSDLLEPCSRTDAELVFDVPIRVASKPGSEIPNFLGPYAQGPASDRFLYLNSGTLAGQTETSWTRRAKIKTAAISRTLVDAALAQDNAVLLVEIDGRAKDGGPCCGTVPPLGGGWTLAL